MVSYVRLTINTHQRFSEDRKTLMGLSPVPRPSSRELSIKNSVWLLNRTSRRRNKKTIKNNFKTFVQIRNSSDSAQDYVEDCCQKCSDYCSITKYKNAAELSTRRVINGCRELHIFFLQLIFIVEATNISRS